MLTDAGREQVEASLREAREGALVSGTNKVMELLTSFGLCREQVIEAKYIGVHGENRDGFGLSAPDCHQLMTQINDVGWDSRQVSAVCVEIEPTKLDTAFLFNQKLVQASGGLLPEMQKYHLKYLSVSASHTNAGLRVINAGLHSTLTAEKVGADPEFRKALQEGLRWRILSHEVCSEFPQLPRLLQAAGNTSSQIARGEHELQILRRINAALLRAQMLGRLGA